MAKLENGEKDSISVGFGTHDGKTSCITFVHTRDAQTVTLFLQPEAARALFRAGLMLCDVLQGDDLDD